MSESSYQSRSSARLQEERRRKESTYVRRSSRDPGASLLDRRDVKQLLRKIKINHRDTIILKIKDHVLADMSSNVLDEILDALNKNRVCQALYLQNLNRAMGDAQLKTLIDLLKSKNRLWALNIGENYNISREMWKHFCKNLPKTYITHLYVSEHVIEPDLKIEMRSNIRENRKKHDLHCSFKNLHVIEKVTNMWWNPINAIKHQLDPSYKNNSSCKLVPAEKSKLVPIELTPAHTAYWAEGYGAGGEKPWKFSCICGEVCSSYENYRYHPIGRMFECTDCALWSHVECALGCITDEDLEEMTEVLCSSCRTKRRRNMKSLVENISESVYKVSIPDEGCGEQGVNEESHSQQTVEDSNTTTLEEIDNQPPEF